MSDLVVTCPKTFWHLWIAEGDPAGTPWSGVEWGWYLGGRRPDIAPGDRLYVVAWGKVRGFAPVTGLQAFDFDGQRWVDAHQARRVEQWCICRRGDAVAVTIPEHIPGFRGWRRRWWPREHECPFPDWQTFGVPQRRAA